MYLHACMYMYVYTTTFSYLRILTLQSVMSPLVILYLTFPLIRALEFVTCEISSLSVRIQQVKLD